ncbi:hypothetical protein TIFTF001_022112 [Ficus carica]|uniref:DUF1677 family protein n=1 Tax=Ficus carica TaxID=3494 RepID=A0AA88DE85_FICCA|nr:hypothetical protein TIFTF001_022112 [Ficus carica]
MALTTTTTSPESHQSQSQAVPPATTTTTSKSASAAAAVSPPATPEVECAKCESCGFTEDCTPAYISRVRDRFHGRWICGLCVEAVKDELLRSDSLISTEEALDRHISFCSSFRSSTAGAGAGHQSEHPISAIGRIFRRSLDSPRALRSNSASSLAAPPPPSLLRSGSCFPSLSR